MKAPTSLHQLQQWFGAQIAQRPNPSFKIEAENAPDHISPSATLLPSERIEIYHQQYWWRLLDALQKNFPFVTRLFGTLAFQSEIAIPYLVAHPPHHWALNTLGDTLPEWMQNFYFEEDRELIIKAAEIDRAAQKSFSIESCPPLDFTSLSPHEIVSKQLTLQPHLQLFKLKSDLFTFRDAFLEKEVDYWSSHPFPELKQGRCFAVLFRNLKNHIAWKPLTSAEFTLLSQFKTGSSIIEACEKIEEEDYNEAQESLSLWFHEWTFLQWFVGKEL